ncbi:MAG: cellulose biosynthesis protein BcsS [Hyphomicrobiaceae bacterium]|nr:cellulose biosynthesis protein BcsS [Hyphomicrobiaceae bacterium]
MRQNSWIAGAAASLIGAFTVASAAHAEGLKDYYAPEPLVTPKSTVTFSGSDWSKDASYFYSGVIYALNRDLGRDGFVLRGFAGVAQYEYDTDVVFGGVVDGDGVQGDVMIGYMWHRDYMTFIGYVGVEYQDYDLTPNDPTNSVNGSEVGFKVAADLVAAYDSPIYWSINGTYSTAFDSYWARGRIGYNAGRFVIGPEVTALGNDGFEAQRAGGFVTLRHELSPALLSEITGYVGHQFVDDDNGSSGSRGGEGVYGGVSFSLVF